MGRDFIETPAGAPSRGFLAGRRVIAASALLYAVSLVLPAIAETYPDGMRIDEQGYLILAMGWMGILIGQVAWFANPIWLLAVILFWRRRWKGAARASVAAVLLGAVSFALYSTGLPSDSGATIRSGLLIGFWCGGAACGCWRSERSSGTRRGTSRSPSSGEATERGGA
jgi:hypothetical protein